MSFRRACLDCGLPGEPGQSRCPKHTKESNAKAKARRGPTPVANAVSARLRRETGLVWCAYGEHYISPLTAEVDHTLPLADGGLDEPGNIQIICHVHHKVKTGIENRSRNA